MQNLETKTELEKMLSGEVFDGADHEDACKANSQARR